jgi:hypothetical protein
MAGVKRRRKKRREYVWCDMREYAVRRVNPFDFEPYSQIIYFQLGLEQCGILW